MRIITGSAGGVTLVTLEGEATRPTAVRVKEALFSMIQFDIEGRRILDLFAGSGQLGLEALSRRASSCVFIDSSREAVDIVLQNAARTKLRGGCRASVYDYAAYLKNAAGREKFDIIFLDPPYNTDCMTAALRLISEGGILAANGTVVCESDTEETERKKRRGEKKNDDAQAVLTDVFGGDEELFALYNIKKSSRYGRTRITLLDLPFED